MSEIFSVVSPENPRDGRLFCFLNDIIQQQQRESDQTLTGQLSKEQLDCMSDFWPSLFERAFLSTPLNRTYSTGPCDDLLIFVPKSKTVNLTPNLQVFRSNSNKLPSRLYPSIDWRESVYLNLLMQYFTYIITVAVCTRTGPQEMQILKRFSQTVYLSPYRWSMTSKESRQEVVYPNVVFNLDNYDQLFADCVLHDGEFLCSELVAYDLHGRLQGVCLLASLHYSSLKQSFDATSNAVIGHFKGSGVRQTTKLVRMGASQITKGFVELAVTPQAAMETSTCLCMRQGQRRPGLSSGCCQICDSGRDGEGFVEANSSSVIVQEPRPQLVDFAECPSSADLFTDWLKSSLPCGANLVPLIDSEIVPLAPVGLAYNTGFKSATASKHASPTRRLTRLPQAFSARSLTALNDLGESGRNVRPTSRVAGIMARFTRPRLSTSSDVPSEVPGHRNSLNAGTPSGHAGNAHRSVGQSWSWFWDRRRRASVGLNASLTCLCLPLQFVLSGIIDMRQEPLLSISE